jgi:Na+-transporting methylmalonyl-CoA/oxaloacetate decarboxylase gamma subunit
MRYAQHRSTVRRSSRSSRRGPFVFLFLLIVATSFGAWTWRKSSAAPEAVASDSTAPVAIPSDASTGEGGADAKQADPVAPVVESVVAAVVPGSVSAHEVSIDRAIDLTYLETGSGFSASASRAVAEGQYTVKVVALPPAIDDLSMTYEAWLVKPGFTDYFSIGTLARREDGKWQIIWKQDAGRVRPDIDQFTTVIVTREARDGNALPSPQHVFEGTFE